MNQDQCGGVSLIIQCDSRPLEVALERMSRLLDLTAKAQAAGIPIDTLMVGTAAAAAATVDQIASPRPISRRDLFRFRF